VVCTTASMGADAEQRRLGFCKMGALAVRTREPAVAVAVSVVSVWAQGVSAVPARAGRRCYSRGRAGRGSRTQEGGGDEEALTA
jgi:hypothetical protein